MNPFIMIPFYHDGLRNYSNGSTDQDLENYDNSTALFERRLSDDALFGLLWAFSSISFLFILFCFVGYIFCAALCYDWPRDDPARCSSTCAPGVDRRQPVRLAIESADEERLTASFLAAQQRRDLAALPSYAHVIKNPENYPLLQRSETVNEKLPSYGSFEAKYGSNAIQTSLRK